MRGRYAIEYNPRPGDSCRAGSGKDPVSETLRHRTVELETLHELGRIAESTMMTPDLFLREACTPICHAFSPYGRVSCRIKVDGYSVRSAEFHEYACRLVTAIPRTGGEDGAIEVLCECDISEAQSILESIGGRVTEILRHLYVDEELRAEREHLESVLVGAQAGTWNWDLKAGEIYVDERFAEILGYRPDRLRQRLEHRRYEMVHPHDLNVLENRIRSVYRNTDSDSMIYMDLRLLGGDESWRWVTIRGRPVPEGCRRAARLSGIIVDISSRRKAEERVRRALAANNEIIESAQCGIAVIDRDYRYTVWNGYMERLTGLSSEEVTGKRAMDLFPFLDESERMKRVSAAFEGRTSTPEEFSFHVEQSGRQAHVFQSFAPVRDDDDSVIGVIFTVQDITRQKELERLRDDVENILRHDLRGQLNTLLNVPSILSQDSSLTDEQRELLDYTRNAAGTMLDLIDNSLTIYKLEAGTYESKTASIEIEKILIEVAAQLRFLAHDRKVEVRLVRDGKPVSEETAGLTVAGDTLLTRSALTHLLTNAIEASPKNGVVHGSVESASGSSSGAVRVTIHNAGAIPPEIRDNFFTKYTTWGKSRGTGLGAYSAKIMLEAQGAAIAVKSNEREGTSISIDFPGSSGE